MPHTNSNSLEASERKSPTDERQTSNSYTTKMGPPQLLKSGSVPELSSTRSNGSSNKIIPENSQRKVMETIPLSRMSNQQKAIAIVENSYVSGFLTICTIFALFGDDLRVGFFTKRVDTFVWDTLFVCFLFFACEIVLNVYGRPHYFAKGLGFSFYLDMISTLSVIPDVKWIWNEVIDTSGSNSSSSQTAALKAGRASRAGTKAGRIVRLVRLFRMIRILQVFKNKNKEEIKSLQISEPSKIGKTLTERTTRRLIIIVLLIIIVSPIIDGAVDHTQDTFQVSQFERLHRFSQDYNASGTISDTEYRIMVEQYVRDSNGLILDISIDSIPHNKIIGWVEATKFQVLNSSTGDWEFDAPYTESINPKTGWSADQLLATPDDKYRTDEYQTIENYGCYSDGKCYDCNTTTSVKDTCHSYVIFNVQQYQRATAQLNLGKTILVMFCFGISIFVLTKDAQLMVIGPIERMMRLVTQLAENPLGATEAKREAYEEDETDPDDYETKMLEDTLSKIGRLLQVGFGAAGTEIIAKNMGGTGELDVMIPGKKITSIFGFGIIENFTETCSVLEEDVITYINTIAEIVHGDAKVYHGAANKNIGSAFLLVWKICDGTLPGMRDPKDPADKPRMSYNEKVKKRQGIVVKSQGSGTVPRAVSPTELVDSALTAILKMRVDIHNANHHGTLEKFCTNTKLIAAFDQFQVHLGFGLHIGWAIEGAIGSKYKIDASYLSPNVNMAARLEAATGQFDVPMLLSEWFVDELSTEARKLCRKIDRVAVKGSEIPMDLWTFDIGHYPASGINPIISEGKQKPVQFDKDNIYNVLQETIPKSFFEHYQVGIGAYFGGQWQLANEKLTAANQIWEDGPTKVILRVMDTESNGTFDAPSWWRGFRQLTEK